MHVNIQIKMSSLLVHVQPHLERTKLCEMGDSELHHSYVSQRERLKKVVTSMIRPKIVQGGTITGKDFVSLLEQVIS